MADIPQDDADVYDMLCKADSVGVFQVESRAQMSMLPRLKPRDFYDLVIEVAIVRPGPIQGDMVHPYLRRRGERRPVVYPVALARARPPDELKHVLGKTLGVPLFQEQAMRLAIVAAKFTDAEADGLRRSMATFRADGTHRWTYEDKFIEGMAGAAIERDFAERCFKQIEGFGSYGFPESHAISFAHPGLCLGLGEMPPPGGVLRRAAEQPADGLLPAGPAGPRRHGARGRGAAARTSSQRLGLHAGAAGRPAHAAPGAAAGPAPGEGPQEGEIRTS